MTTVDAFVAWAGSFALFALAALVFESSLLRRFGAASMLVPTVFLFSEANLNTADAGSYLVFVPMAFVGLGLWVTGHALHRAQHGWWKSPLAGRLWTVPACTHRRLAAGNARRPGSGGSRSPVAYPPSRARP